VDRSGPNGPELSIILVNYNDRPHLFACLSSLGQAAGDRRAEIILVDNQSTDGSPEMVESTFPRVRIVRLGENAGFARANNIGIKAASGDFLLFLNTDTVVPESSLAALLAALESRPKAGAIGPALRRRSGYQVSFGKEVNFFGELWQKCVRNPYFKIALRFSRRAREVGWLSGACLLARRRAVEEAGLFDERFFLYFEDIDLCRRMRKKGYRLLFYPRVEVFHEGGAVTSRLKWRRRLEYRRSQLYYYRKHTSSVSLGLLTGYLKLNFLLWRAFRLGPAARGGDLPEQMERFFRSLRQ
jgi:GT2 family glycosyltransferase